MHQNSNSVQHQYKRIFAITLMVILFVVMCFMTGRSQTVTTTKTTVTKVKLVEQSKYDSAVNLAAGFQLLYNKSQTNLRTSESNLATAKRQLTAKNKTISDYGKTIKDLKLAVQKTNLQYLSLLQKVKDAWDYIDTHPAMLPSNKLKNLKKLLQLQ